MPKVSVVMPVHNGERFLAQSIDSILSQTFGDLEFVIVDDGSVDRTEAIIRSYPDKRICYIKNDMNMGVSNSLNKGIDCARGEYIARMDADDISLPQRFQRQTDFLNAHPDVCLCGTWGVLFGEAQGIKRTPVTDEEIRCWALFHTPFLHPSVMFRRDVFQRSGLRYTQNIPAQDYDLWTRIPRAQHMANIPRVLIRYRVHQNSVGGRCSDKQVVYADLVRERLLLGLGFPSLSVEQKAVHRLAAELPFNLSREEHQHIDQWLQQIDQHNRTSRSYSVPILSETLSVISVLAFFRCKGPARGVLLPRFWMPFLIMCWKKLIYAMGGRGCLYQSL